MNRILTCYLCEKTFTCIESKAKNISYGKTNAFCNKCWLEYLEFCKYVGKDP